MVQKYKKDEGLEYTESPDGTRQLDGMEIRYDPNRGNNDFTLGDYLNDWQLSFRFTAEQMVAKLGLVDAVAAFTGAPYANVQQELAGQWQQMVLGELAPGPELIAFLTKAYANDFPFLMQADNDDGGKIPTAREFRSKAFYGMRVAREEKGNEGVIRFPKGLELSSPRSDANGVTEQPDPMLPVYVRRRSGETTGSDTYREFHRAFQHQAHGRGLDTEMVLRDIAAKVREHPWVIQGFLKSSWNKEEPAAEQGLALPGAEGMPDPAVFFNQSRGLDFIGGQRYGLRLSYHELLKLGCQYAGISSAKAAEYCAEQGYPFTPPAIDGWKNGRSLPPQHITPLLENMLHLDRDQRQEFRQAYDLTLTKKRVRGFLDHSLARLAGTEDFTFRNILKLIITASQLHPEDFAYYAGLYPSSVNAFTDGELIPGPKVINRLGTFLGLDNNVTEMLGKLASRERSRLRNPGRVMLNNVLGDAVGDTTSRDIHETLLDKDSPFFDRADAKSEGARNLMDAHKTKATRVMIGKLARRMGIAPDSEQFRLYSEISAERNNRPFGVLLENYVLDGGNDLGEFLTFAMSKEGWNINQRELCEKTGIGFHSLANIIERSGIEQMEAIDKFTNAFHLNRTQEALFFRLSRADKKLPPPQKLIEFARRELAAGGDAESIALTLARTLVKQTGFPHSKIKTRMNGHSFPINLHKEEGLNLPDYPHPSLIDEFAAILLPHDSQLARDAANTMLGILHEKTPRQLLGELREHKIGFPAMLRSIRKQWRLTQQEYADIIPYRRESGKPLSSSEISALENGEYHMPQEIVEAYATLLGFENGERADLIALARDKYIEKTDKVSNAELLERVKGKTITFAEFINETLKQHSIPITELARRISVSDSSIRKWQRGAYVTNDAAVAARFADYMGYTEPADKDVFIRLASNDRYGFTQRVRTKEEFLGEIRTGQLNMKNFINDFAGQHNLSFPALGRAIHVDAAAVRRWGTEDDARLYPPAAIALADYVGYTEPDDRADFIAFAIGQRPRTLVPIAGGAPGEDENSPAETHLSRVQAGLKSGSGGRSGGG